ncbi:MAG TPA: thioester reductase domain-containing protein, partial [Longimicrobiaceae bacterium]|nr:thioester reductase domain-containing protein [Longimicrobiaceae bacterium]
AGYAAPTCRGPVGVYAGASANNYLLWSAWSNPEARGAFDPFQGGLLSRDFLAAWTSYKLNLRGPAANLQTACSTSLVAVHFACQGLLNGECGMALAGGVSIGLPPRRGYRYEEGGVLSPDGHTRAFDAEARGTVPGSGAGVVALKRLEDALADGDPVHAVILSSAINNDGSLKAGFTAPSVQGQVKVIETAHALAGVDPETVSLVEAHGSGTPLGDPIEVAALTRVFRAGTPRAGFCALGSVKSNVGHLDAAAGVAGLIKAVLAVREGEIPPSLHFRSPNPEAALPGSPFYVNAALRRFGGEGAPRRAGVNSLGIGGTNAHVVLEEAPARGPSGPERPWKLLALSARSEAALRAQRERLRAHLEAHPGLSLADVAYTLHVGRAPFAHRFAAVCRDAGDALRALAEGEGAVLGRAREGADGVDAHLPAAAAGAREALLAVGRAWAAGVEVDWEALHEGERRHRVPLPTYPFEREYYWLAGRGPRPSAPRPAAAPRAEEARPLGPRPNLLNDYVEPRDERERKIAAVWTDLFGIGEIGVYDDFYELGGTSLLAPRLVLRLREAFGVELPLDVLYAAPSVAALAEAVGILLEEAPEGPAPAAPRTELAAEAVLAPEIRPRTASRERAAPGSVLLTGATGFLGAYLLHALLRRTGARVHCLVRAGGREEGARRIRAALESYGLWSDADAARIVPVPGDLAEPLLGLGEEGFDALADTVEAVYHNGARVNHTFPYAALRAPNVGGTHEVLRLACRKEPRPVHYVSTVAVLAPPRGGDAVLPEDDPGDGWESIHGGYAQSKWVAERLVREAGARGLPVSIYRPGLVTGDTRTGICPTHDFAWRLVKACVLAGAVPDVDTDIDMAPVDHVSRAIVELSLGEDSSGRTFHLVNPHPVRWSALFAAVRSFGFAATPTPLHEWEERLAEAAHAEDHPLHPFVALIGRRSRGTADAGEVRTRRYSCRNTLKGLSGTGIECPPVGEKLLHMYLASLVRAGFLETPGHGLAAGATPGTYPG